MLNLISYSTCQNTDSHRGFGSSLWGQVSQVGSQWVKSVQNSVDEIGKVASVLAGDATDAVNTVSKLRVFNSCQKVQKIFLKLLPRASVLLLFFLFKTISSKGQLISKCPFGVIVWTKIPTKKFDKFLP